MEVLLIVVRVLAEDHHTRLALTNRLFATLSSTSIRRAKFPVSCVVTCRMATYCKQTRHGEVAMPVRICTTEFSIMSSRETGRIWGEYADVCQTRT